MNSLKKYILQSAKVVGSPKIAIEVCRRRKVWFLKVRGIRKIELGKRYHLLKNTFKRNHKLLLFKLNKNLPQTIESRIYSLIATDTARVIYRSITKINISITLRREITRKKTI